MQPRSGNPALQNGLLFGLILGVVETALIFLLGFVGFILNVILFLFLVGFAGYRASARTGKTGSGVLTGFLIGLISSVIPSVVLLIFSLGNIDTLRQQLQQSANNLNQGIAIDYTNNVVIALVLLFLVILVVGACLLALGVGAIGGAIGKGRAQVTSIPQYPGPMYMPPPPYPPQGYAPPPQEYIPSQQEYPPSPQEYMPPPPRDNN